jgi:hypothetical protein
MKKYLFPVLILIFTGLLFSSCDNNDAEQHPDIKITYRSYPFYRDFSAIDTQNISLGLKQLHQKYPTFLDFYLDTLAGLNVHHQYNDSLSLLRNFLTYKDYRALFDTVNKAFPDTKIYDRELKSAFRNIKFYDSAIVLPRSIYYFVSGLNLYTAVLHNDSVLGIGLDMFLGRDFAPYASVGIPEYATVRFTKENIPVWACKVIYENRFPFIDENKNLLEMMLEKGKEIYFLDKALPETALATKLGYTAAQLKWCEKKEAWIYNFFIENKLLYEKNHQKVMRYVLDGPNTPGFPNDAPGNLGSFIGYRIIQQYAKHSNLPLDALFSNKDTRQILATARYKP